jgi:hypothetical protein
MMWPNLDLTLGALAEDAALGAEGESSGQEKNMMGRKEGREGEKQRGMVSAPSQYQRLHLSMLSTLSVRVVGRRLDLAAFDAMTFHERAHFQLISRHSSRRVDLFQKISNTPQLEQPTPQARLAELCTKLLVMCSSQKQRPSLFSSSL